ncbi:hypothetical protein DQ356_07340 [Chryseobacterium lacus]|uniref:Type II toxin-antitoxin system RelE/ParE family toxin n=1 Tax=Chryseobacterium lacus TaxID=2058346 RepID=A0A368MZD2_9FLAO|nr:hypothetical protein DQ356_07340 [Chryseobacterium lacus]
MERMIVQYLPEVEKYLNELSLILFEKNYFSFVESSFRYVDDLIDFIEYNLPIFPAKQTPEKLSSLGSEYIFYKANQNTTWYIFFERSDNRFMVTFITNSHSDLVKLL